MLEVAAVVFGIISALLGVASMSYLLFYGVTYRAIIKGKDRSLTTLLLVAFFAFVYAIIIIITGKMLAWLLGCL